MKLRMFAVFSAVTVIAGLLVASDSQQILKARRKAVGNCKEYRQDAKQGSKWTLDIGPVKVSHETQPVKPSDELTRLGLRMFSICQQYESDPNMTENDFAKQMAEAQTQKAEVFRAIATLRLELRDTIRLSPEVKIDVKRGKD